MAQLWARMVKKNRIIQSETIPFEDLYDSLGEICRKLDIPRPIFLTKHEKEWREFQQTSFTAYDFVEAIAFDKLEIEHIDLGAPKKKSQDPRNG